MTWLSVATVSKLIKKEERTIRYAVDRNEYGEENEGYRYVKGKGRGGKQLLIALESLPLEAQDRYNGVSEKTVNILECTTGKQREKADFRALIVTQYRQSGLSVDEFVNIFNFQNPEDCITANQLYSWNRKYKNKNVLDLVDGRGGHNKGKTSISDEAWEDFKCLYMAEQ